MATLKNTVIDDTGFLEIGAGTDAQRPGSPTVGAIRYNTDRGYAETWSGPVGWIETIDSYQSGDQSYSGSSEENRSSFRVSYFTSNGGSTFTVPDGVRKVQVLIVAGGGSGGHQVGGGGGAGGMIEIADYPVFPGQVIPVTVGAGGPAPGFQPSNNISFQGSPSSFAEIVAVGGGYGGNHSGGGSGPGGAGGSGGGAGAGPGGNSFGSANQPQYTEYGAVGHGFPGGNGHPSPWCGGGGGGAGGRGTNAIGGETGGQGGRGRVSYITGEARWYAGGGGGGSESPGTTHWGRGGVGGGGRGSANDGGKDNYPDMSGRRNTGGGGGGTRDHPSGAGTGGPGVVIIRY
jgi:hypothetical protein